jgi:hypothetical protein
MTAKDRSLRSRWPLANGYLASKQEPSFFAVEKLKVGIPLKVNTNVSRNASRRNLS